MKKFVSIFMCFIILASLFCPASAASNNSQPVPSIQDILSNYHDSAFIAKMSSEDGVSTVSGLQTDSSKPTLEEETVNTLIASGYEAYNVTSSNYDSMETALNTDLSSLGISPDGSYVVVVGSDDSAAYSSNAANERISVSPQATYDASFTYDYEGKTYTLRYLTVTAADYQSYAKASTYDLTQYAGTTSASVLENLLNASISAILDEISGSFYLGTISSICGLDVFDFSTNSAAFGTLTYNAGSNWTRIFTQVWSEYQKKWVTTLHVEYVTMTAYMSGLYYDAASNAYKAVPTDFSQKLGYSLHFSDRTYRVENAIKGFLSNVTYYDLTGHIRYTYQNSTVITHLENF